MFFVPFHHYFYGESKMDYIIPSAFSFAAMLILFLCNKGAKSDVPVNSTKWFINQVVSLLSKNGICKTFVSLSFLFNFYLLYEVCNWGLFANTYLLYFIIGSGFTYFFFMILFAKLKQTEAVKLNGWLGFVMSILMGFAYYVAVNGYMTLPFNAHTVQQLESLGIEKTYFQDEKKADIFRRRVTFHSDNQHFANFLKSYSELRDKTVDFGKIENIGHKKWEWILRFAFALFMFSLLHIKATSISKRA